jgi:O-antigen/teichoic acid export membrane protein
MVHSGLPPSFVRNLSWQSVATGSSLILGFVSSLLIGWRLGAAGFGLYGFGLGTANLTMRFFRPPVYETCVRCFSDYQAREDMPGALAVARLCFLVEIAGALAGLLVVCSLAVVLACSGVFTDAKAMAVAWGGMASAASTTSSLTAVAVLRSLQRYHQLAILKMVEQSLLLAGAATALFVLGGGAAMVLAAATVCGLVNSSVLVIWAYTSLAPLVPAAGRRQPLRSLAARGREFVSFGRDTYLASLANLPAREFDVVLLGWLAPLQVVGAYHLAKRFMAGLDAVTEVAVSVLYPALAGMVARAQFAEVRRLLVRWLAVAGAGGILLALAVSVLVRGIVCFFLDAGYRDVPTLFCCLALGAAVSLPLCWAQCLAMALGRSRELLAAALCAGAGTLVLEVLGLLAVGPHGLAVACGMGTPLLSLIVLAFLRRSRRPQAGPALS